MRVNIYDTKLNFSNGRVDVIKERAINYSPIRRMDTPYKVSDFCRDYLHLHEEPEEHCYIFCFDGYKRVIGLFELARGNSNAVMVDCKTMFSRALMVSASALIFVHNHPNGNPLPSQEDLSLTETLWRIGQFLKVPILDSLIIGGGEFPIYYSMMEHDHFKSFKEIDIYA